MEKRIYDYLEVIICETNEDLGFNAAREFAEIIQSDIQVNGNSSVILATGNSQLSFLKALTLKNGMAWDKIVVFNMDTYLGLPANHPASFTRFISEKLTDIVQPAAFYDLQSDCKNVESEIRRYTHLLNTYNPVVCVLGIGENGHLAFNDPPAKFYTPKMVDVVTLSQESRLQQVGEGHFDRIDDVPQKAISLTIPALLNHKHILAVVPEARKARIVKEVLEGPITPECPASILRTLPHVKLYLDRESASLLK
jgi:glucosamine-6-phosphate deaminase